MRKCIQLKDCLATLPLSNEESFDYESYILRCRSLFKIIAKDISWPLFDSRKNKPLAW